MRRTALVIALGSLVAAAFWPSASPAQANSQNTASQLGTVRVTTIATGLQNPWGLAFLPDGNFLVTERPGRLRVVTPQGGVSTALTGVPAVFAQGQGGLLDVALDPAFASNRRVYLSFAEPGTNGTAGTAVYRAELNAGSTGLVNGSVIFRATPKLNTQGHFGSRLAFGTDGFLYVSSGDNQNNATAQRQKATGSGTSPRHSATRLAGMNRAGVRRRPPPARHGPRSRGSACGARPGRRPRNPRPGS
jgi:glucose/arabinose dehydrogenase